MVDFVEGELLKTVFVLGVDGDRRGGLSDRQIWVAEGVPEVASDCWRGRTRQMTSNCLRSCGLGGWGLWSGRWRGLRSMSEVSIII